MGKGEIGSWTWEWEHWGWFEVGGLEAGAWSWQVWRRKVRRRAVGMEQWGGGLLGRVVVLNRAIEEC